ncbi:hypothetical protein FQZ97_977050 [compost metagenome]
MDQRQAAREPGLADLLGPALQPAAQHRDVLVDVDERAVEAAARCVAARRFDLEHHDGLAVLRVHGVEHFAPVVAARLPVGEMHAAMARGHADLRRHQRGAACGIEREAHIDQPPGVVPRRRLHERTAARSGEGWSEGRRRRTRHRRTCRDGVKEAPHDRHAPRPRLVRQ